MESQPSAKRLGCYTTSEPSPKRTSPERTEMGDLATSSRPTAEAATVIIDIASSDSGDAAAPSRHFPVAKAEPLSSSDDECAMHAGINSASANAVSASTSPSRGHFHRAYPSYDAMFVRPAPSSACRLPRVMLRDANSELGSLGRACGIDDIESRAMVASNSCEVSAESPFPKLVDDLLDASAEIDFVEQPNNHILLSVELETHRNEVSRVFADLPIWLANGVALVLYFCHRDATIQGTHDFCKVFMFLHCLSGERNTWRAHNGHTYMYSNGGWRLEEKCDERTITDTDEQLAAITVLFLLLGGLAKTRNMEPCQRDTEKVIRHLKAILRPTTTLAELLLVARDNEEFMKKHYKENCTHTAHWAEKWANRMTDQRKLCKNAQRYSEVLKIFISWGNTEKPASELFQLTFDNAFAQLREPTWQFNGLKSPAANCYTCIPYNLPDKAALKVLGTLRRFLRTVFFNNDGLLRLILCMIVLALAGRIRPVNRMLCLVDTGGRGKSLFSKLLKSLVGSKLYRSLDPLVLASLDEMRKQGSNLVGSAICVLEESTQTGGRHEFQFSLWKKLISGGEVCLRPPYATRTWTHSFGDAFYIWEMNPPVPVLLRLPCDAADAPSQVVRRMVAGHLVARFVPDEAMVDETSGIFLQQDYESFLDSTATGGAFVRHWVLPHAQQYKLDVCASYVRNLQLLDAHCGSEVHNDTLTLAQQFCALAATSVTEGASASADPKTVLTAIHRETAGKKFFKNYEVQNFDLLPGTRRPSTRGKKSRFQFFAEFVEMDDRALFRLGNTGAIRRLQLEDIDKFTTLCEDMGGDEVFGGWSLWRDILSDNGPAIPHDSCVADDPRVDTLSCSILERINLKRLKEYTATTKRQATELRNLCARLDSLSGENGDYVDFETTYFRKHNIAGRRYAAKFAGQRMHRGARVYAYGDFCWDVDMKNCHVGIARNLLEQSGNLGSFPIFHLHATHYASWRTWLSRYFNIPISKAKAALHKIMYGGSPTVYGEEIPFMLSLRREVEQIASVILGLPRFQYLANMFTDRTAPLFARLFFAISAVEDEHLGQLEVTFRAAGLRVNCLVFDGCIVCLADQGTVVDVDAVVANISQVIFPVSIKPFGEETLGTSQVGSDSALSQTKSMCVARIRAQDGAQDKTNCLARCLKWLFGDIAQSFCNIATLPRTVRSANEFLRPYGTELQHAENARLSRGSSTLVLEKTPQSKVGHFFAIQVRTARDITVYDASEGFVYVAKKTDFQHVLTTCSANLHFFVTCDNVGAPSATTGCSHAALDMLGYGALQEDSISPADPYTCGLCGTDFSSSLPRRSVCRQRLKAHTMTTHRGGRLGTTPRAATQISKLGAATAKLEPQRGGDNAQLECERNEVFNINGPYIAIGRATYLLRAIGPEATLWRHLFALDAAERCVLAKQHAVVIIHDVGLPRLVVTASHGNPDAMSHEEMCSEYPNVYFVGTNPFFGMTYRWLFKICTLFMEGFNCYSARRGIMTMYQDTAAYELRKNGIGRGLAAADLEWVLGSVPGEHTILSFLRVGERMLRDVLAHRLRHVWCADGDILRVDMSIKPALRVRGKRNLCAILGMRGMLLSLSFLSGTECGATIKDALRPILETRREYCDVATAIPDFIFDNAEIGEAAVRSLVAEIFPGASYASSREAVLVAGCPVHPIMRIVDRKSDACLDSTHLDYALLLKCFRIHMRRYSTLEREGSRDFQLQLGDILQTIPTRYYSPDGSKVRNATTHPLNETPLRTQTLESYDEMLQTAPFFTPAEGVTLERFFTFGDSVRVGQRLRSKLANYHAEPYAFRILAPQFQNGKWQPADHTIRRKVLLPCGAVALLLGYSVCASNATHAPITSFGAFKSVADVATETARLLAFFQKPVVFALAAGEYAAIKSRIRTPKQRSILSPKIRKVFIHTLYRCNLKGFFAHSLLAHRVYNTRGISISISTTSVEAFFSEFNSSTRRLQMQRDITPAHADSIVFFLLRRRLSTACVAHAGGPNRGLNSQGNNIAEALLDFAKVIDTHDATLSDKWTELCLQQRGLYAELRKKHKATLLHTSRCQSPKRRKVRPDAAPASR